ncbi:MAG: GNAT family N-acetyltransferase [Waterburya sp.]
MQKYLSLQLTPRDFDRATDLLIEAFYDNPAHVYIFMSSNESKRLKAIHWAFRLNLNLQASIGDSFALVESDKPPGEREIKQMAFWHSPNSGSINLMSMVKEGLLTMPFLFGWRTFKRVIEVTEEFDAIKDRVTAKNPVWHLNNMVVAKELRGSGIGSKVLKNQLESVVDPSGFPTILMTQREVNVRFYQRLGFEVVDDSTIGSGEHKFTNWCMVRPSS